MRNDIEYVRSLEARLKELRAAADKADVEYRDEIARLRLTDAEREAVNIAQNLLVGTAHGKSLGSLLERLGGER